MLFGPIQRHYRCKSVPCAGSTTKQLGTGSTTKQPLNNMFSGAGLAAYEFVLRFRSKRVVIMVQCCFADDHWWRAVSVCLCVCVAVCLRWSPSKQKHMEITHTCFTKNVCRLVPTRLVEALIVKFTYKKKASWISKGF